MKEEPNLATKILAALRTIKRGNSLEIYMAVYPEGGNNFYSLVQKLGNMVNEKKIVRVERGIYGLPATKKRKLP